jgi:xanthine dehydrogenase accessory factor
VRDVLQQIDRWMADGKKVAIATVVNVERSAPREPGAVMALSQDGEVAGSVSGGCVESAVYEEAMEVLTTGVPKRLTYGIADDQAMEVGLTCGGTIHLFVERLDW